MNARSLLLIAFVLWSCLVFPVRAQDAAPPGGESTVEVTGPPARPESRVLDQAGLLSATERGALTRQFAAAADEGISLYFIGLKSAGGLPEQDAAGELARLWDDAPLTTVILHLPGEPLSLGFAASRLPSIQQEEMNALTQSALTEGLVQPTLREQITTTANRLTRDFARYRNGESLTPLAAPLSRSAAAGSRHQLILRGGAAAVFLLLVLLVFLRHRRARRPRLFPLTVPRTRFSAPHSGGNNALISFADQRKE